MSDQTIQLMHGDSRVLLPLIPDGSIDLIVTDPPYPTVSGGTDHSAGPQKKGHISKYSVIAKNDGRIFQHNDIKPSEYLPEFYRVLKEDADLYVMVNVLNLREFLDASHAAGFRLHNLLIWDKGTGTPNRWYMKNLEMTLYLYKGKARTINLPGSKQSFTCPNPKGKKHPCEKPVYLMNQYVLNSSQAGETVLDPFMGSGTVGESCWLNRRRFIGMEQDPAYFAVSQQRMSNMTGSFPGIFAGNE